MKKLLIGVGVVVLLLVAAAVAIPFFVSADSLKAELIGKVKEATGRDLRINGRFSFSLLPSASLEADDVAFANPPGAASPDMAKLAKLQVDLKLIPLLSGRVEIARLVLVDPVIALEVDKQGRANWQFAASATRPAPAPSPAAPASRGLGGLQLDDVRLDNGTLSYRDLRSGEAFELDQIAMQLSWAGIAGPFSADGSAVYRGEKLTLLVRLAHPGAALAGETDPVELKLESKPVTIDFRGEAAGPVPLTFRGTVELTAPSLRGLAAWAGTPIHGQDSGFGPLAIAGKVSLAGSKAAFTETKLTLDQIAAQGELAVEMGGARPGLTGRLDVDKLDFNPYLGPETKGWSDAPVDASLLKSADAELQLNANSVLYRKLQFSKSALAVHLKNARLEADLNQLAAYQGTGKGRVVLDGSGAAPAIEVQLALAQVQVQPFLHDQMNLDRLSGTGSLTLHASGHGRSEREIIASLSGNGNFNIVNGKIRGMNLTAMARNVTSAFDGGNRGTGETDFSSLTASFTIAGGIMHNGDLQLRSADMPMAGAGVIDLPRRSVDYRVTPRVAGILVVPVVIRGPWDNLSYEPDLAGIGGHLLEGGAKGIGDTIKKAPSDVLKVPQDALKGIFGR